MILNENTEQMDVYVGHKRIIHNTYNPVEEGKKKLKIDKPLEWWFCGAFGEQAIIVDPITTKDVFSVRYGENSKFYDNINKYNKII